MAADFQNKHVNACKLSPDGHFGSKYVTVVVTGMYWCHLLQCSCIHLFIIHLPLYVYKKYIFKIFLRFWSISRKSWRNVSLVLHSDVCSEIFFHSVVGLLKDCYRKINYILAIVFLSRSVTSVPHVW